jgi:hypothetical protein
MARQWHCISYFDEGYNEAENESSFSIPFPCDVESLPYDVESQVGSYRYLQHTVEVIDPLNTVTRDPGLPS